MGCGWIDDWLSNVCTKLPGDKLCALRAVCGKVFPHGICSSGSLCSGLNFAGKLLEALLIKLGSGGPLERVEHVFAFEKKPSAQKFIRACACFINSLYGMSIQDSRVACLARDVLARC